MQDFRKWVRDCQKVGARLVQKTAVGARWVRADSRDTDIVDVLLDLVAAVGRGQIDDEAQLPGGVVDVLAFEGTLFGLVGPRQSLVEVHPAVQDRRGQNQLPAHRFHQLQNKLTISAGFLLDIIVKDIYESAD